MYPFSSPILSTNGSVASIIAADVAPDISPKVRTVFFMEFKSPNREICVHVNRTVAGKALAVVILSGDSLTGSGKSSFWVAIFHGISPADSADLNGLCAPLCAELIEQPARMGLDSVFPAEHPPPHPPIPQSL